MGNPILLFYITLTNSQILHDKHAFKERATIKQVS